jgi:hypothetical protein
MIPEVWAVAPGFDGRYLVSSCGRVMNVETGRELKVRLGTTGYPYVILYRPGGRNKPHYRTVHLLVAGAFLRNPDRLPTVDHIDNDKTNNRVENLRYASMNLQSHNRTKRPNATSRYRGVSFERLATRRPWVAQTCIRGAKIKLGCFATEEEAARRYNEAVLEIYGDQAFLNEV